MNRPCLQCGQPILLVKGPKGDVLALDVESRKHVFELSDSSVELVASRIDAQETYVSHALLCRPGVTR